MKQHGNMDIGLQVRQVRETLGMTQVQLAKRVGMRQSVIAEIESGKRRDLRQSTIQRLSTGLMCHYVSALAPEKNLQDLMDERSEKLARNMVFMNAGSAALEQQLPNKKFLEEMVQKTKQDILKNYRSALWDQE